jgi:hypothetical protein
MLENFIKFENFQKKFKIIKLKAEYSNIERGEAEFNIVVLCSIKPHIDQVQV